MFQIVRNDTRTQTDTSANRHNCECLPNNGIVVNKLYTLSESDRSDRHKVDLAGHVAFSRATRLRLYCCEVEKLPTIVQFKNSANDWASPSTRLFIHELVESTQPRMDRRFSIALYFTPRGFEFNKETVIGNTPYSTENLKRNILGFSFRRINFSALLSFATKGMEVDDICNNLKIQIASCMQDGMPTHMRKELLVHLNSFK